jgi:hypothetical protein
MEQDDSRKNTEDDEVKVTDRRKFTREGERISSETASRNSTPSSSEEPATAGADSEVPESTPGEDPSTDLFVTHIMALSQLGMIHLGRLENPSTNKAEVNLPAAREVIDLLGMLRDKTQGNLSSEEQNLLDTWLYQLRMEFTKQAGSR